MTNKKRLFFYSIILFFILPLATVNSQSITENDRIKSGKIYNNLNFTKMVNSFIDSVIYYQYDRYNDYQKHKETFTYSDSNFITDILDEIWDADSSKWINYSRETKTYDENFNITEELGELWSDGEWDNWWRNEYTFNNDGFKKTWQYSNWALFGSWLKGVKETYSYDDRGNLILKEAVNNFKNTWRDSLIYDSQNKLVTYFAKDWVDDQWVNDWIETYIYDDAGNLIEMLREEWENEQWIESRKEEFVYNSFNNLILHEYYFPIGPDQWEIAERATYEYNDNQNLVHGKYEGKDGANWVLINGSMKFEDIYGNYFGYGRETELVVHYDGVTGIKSVEEKDLDFRLAQNYPNPFNPNTNIKFSLTEPGNVKLIIYNLLGEKVKVLVDEFRQPGTFETTFNASRLSSGTYFYRLETPNYVDVKKMLLLK